VGQQRDLYTRKSQTTRHDGREKLASTCERYTHGGVVTAYKNEREHSNPSSRGPAGGWKGDKIVGTGQLLRSGIGIQLHCTNDSCIQSPGPIRTWTTPSRQCFHVLTDADDSNSCEVDVDGSRRLDPGRDDLPNKVSVSFFPPLLCPPSRTRSIRELRGIKKPTLLLISTCGPRGKTTPTPAQSIWPSALRFS